MSDSEDESLHELISMRNELLNQLGVEENEYFKKLDENESNASNEQGLLLKTAKKTFR